ncbi:MAG: hypothetical protein P8X53_04385, partial [Chromatiales bacterium]
VWMDERAMTLGLMTLLPSMEFDPDIAEAGGSDGGNAGGIGRVDDTSGADAAGCAHFGNIKTGGLRGAA